MSAISAGFPPAPLERRQCRPMAGGVNDGWAQGVPSKHAYGVLRYATEAMGPEGIASCYVHLQPSQALQQPFDAHQVVQGEWAVGIVVNEHVEIAIRTLFASGA